MAEPVQPSDAAAAVGDGRPQVVYVMGSGRSGSTILGIALGNCDDFVYAGELDNWLTRSGIPSLGGTERTRFWSSVREQVGGEDLFGSESHRYLERSRAALRIDRWRARRGLRPRFRRLTEDLYRAIAHTASASYVVDTAHFPLRARELQAIAGIDLHLIFLVRDPQSVVASFARTLDRNDSHRRRLLEISTNADLWLTHLLSVIVFLRQPRERRMFLRHEQLLADPEGVLGEILARLGAPTVIPNLGSLSTGMPLRGNRLISSDVVALKQQLAPHPGRQSPVTALLQLPWRVVFSRMQPQVMASRSREAPPRPTDDHLTAA